MATVDVQGTEFTCSVLPLKLFSKGYWARTEISVKNEYITYTETGENIAKSELEEWIYSMFRLLAGAYAKEYSLSFEKAGIAIDFYPYTKNGEEVPREDRRKNDCVMAVRLLMRSADKKSFLGGVYSVLLHRAEIEAFALSLKREAELAFAALEARKGKYLFVGVSPLGYKGCNYWYLDETKTVSSGDYVWVSMGRHKTEQIVYVDSVRYCNDDTAPYDPMRIKKVLRKATAEQISKLQR